MRYSLSGRRFGCVCGGRHPADSPSRGANIRRLWPAYGRCRPLRHDKLRHLFRQSEFGAIAAPHLARHPAPNRRNGRELGIDRPGRSARGGFNDHCVFSSSHQNHPHARHTRTFVDHVYAASRWGHALAGLWPKHRQLAAHPRKCHRPGAPDHGDGDPAAKTASKIISSDQLALPLTPRRSSLASTALR